ncbi:MAG: orotidine-5'-phosphate decarboxylase [Thermoguttaceae bacterium]
MTTFSTSLANAIKQKRSPVLVGLDPRFDSLPSPFREGVDEKNFANVAKSFQQFCCEVIDVVAPLVPAVKPQAAFFEQYGHAGMTALHHVIQHAQKKGVLVVFDGKRNDIGSTAQAYAAGILGGNSAWGADALTVSPYLGDDSIEPFVKTAVHRSAGIFVLVKTSNPGGGMLQDLVVRHSPLYKVVAEYVENLANSTKNENENYGAVGAVVGATWPTQLAELRAMMPHSWFLVPGFGNQGGSAEDVAPAFDSEGLGAIINNSRGIIFAHKKNHNRSELAWQKSVEEATIEMIDQLRAKTSACML